MNTYIGKIGLLKAREANSNGRIVTTCTGRLMIPAAALQEIAIKEGERYQVCAGEQDYELIIKKSPNVKSKKLGGARTVKFQSFYFLDFHANTCRLASQDLELTELVLFVRDGQLIARMPDSVILVHTVKDAEARRALKEERLKNKPADFREAIAGLQGAAAALALDSWRYDMKEKPASIEHIVWILREEGHRVSKINERLWKLDDTTATLGDLTELAQKYENGIVLVAA